MSQVQYDDGSWSREVDVRESIQRGLLEAHLGKGVERDDLLEDQP